MTNSISRRLVALSICAAASLAIAGGDHSHDAPPSANAAPAPRFAAQSEAFEVVGVLQGDELAVFVDRFEDNAPVLDAKVEIESGSFKAAGKFHADHGDYSFPADAFKAPGSYPIQITLTVGKEIDLLAADLVVPDSHAGHDHSGDASMLRRFGPWIGGGAGVLVLLIAWVLMRTRRSQGAIR